MTCPHAHLDGAYVLGSLSSAERLEFERHLPGCPVCSASVRDLAGLPGLLAKVGGEDWERPGGDERVPATLLPHLTAAVAARRRRVRLGVAGGAAAAVVLGGATVAAAVRQDPPAPPGPPQTVAQELVMSPVAGSDLEASVALTTVPWGTRVDLTCRYDALGASGEASGGASGGGWGDGGGTADPVYTLVLRTGDGAEQVATWRPVPTGEEMHLTAATATDEDRIASVEVRDAAGETVLRLDR